MLFAASKILIPMIKCQKPFLETVVIKVEFEGRIICYTFFFLRDNILIFSEYQRWILDWPWILLGVANMLKEELAWSRNWRSKVKTRNRSSDQPSHRRIDGRTLVVLKIIWKTSRKVVRDNKLVFVLFCYMLIRSNSNLIWLVHPAIQSSCSGYFRLEELVNQAQI